MSWVQSAARGTCATFYVKVLPVGGASCTRTYLPHTLCINDMYNICVYHHQQQLCNTHHCLLAALYMYMYMIFALIFNSSRGRLSLVRSFQGANFSAPSIIGRTLTKLSMWLVLLFAWKCCWFCKITLLINRTNCFKLTVPVFWWNNFPLWQLDTECQ